MDKRLEAANEAIIAGLNHEELLALRKKLYNIHNDRLGAGDYDEKQRLLICIGEFLEGDADAATKKDIDDLNKINLELDILRMEKRNRKIQTIAASILAFFFIGIAGILSPIYANIAGELYKMVPNADGDLVALVRILTIFYFDLISVSNVAFLFAILLPSRKK